MREAVLTGKPGPISAVLLLAIVGGGLPAAALDVTRGALVEGVACLSDPTQTYTLYLPASYSPERRWPVLLIFDPRGRSLRAAEIFREAAERYGWILLSSNDTRSDGPGDVNVKAVSAMLPELARFAFDPRRTYAAGFSGGAMLAWSVSQDTQGLAGVIGSGGRPLDRPHRDTEVPFAFFGAAGDGEFNYEPTRALVAIAGKHGAPYRFESFPGPHRWMPPDLAFEAVEWMELQAMRAGTRPRDPELTAVLYAKDLARAEALERAGNALAARRRYDAIARTFEGLRELEDVQGRAQRLAASAAVKEALAREKRARRYYDSRTAGTGRTLARFRSPGAVLDADALATNLRLEPLMRTAEGDSAKGLAARRVISGLNAQVAFYLPREFLSKRDPARAAALLEVATRIDDRNPRVWYDLACARAQTARPDRALDALARAVDTGYDDVDYLEQDRDLDPLRKLPGYLEIVQGLREQNP